MLKIIFFLLNIAFIAPFGFYSSLILLRVTIGVNISNYFGFLVILYFFSSILPWVFWHRKSLSFQDAFVIASGGPILWLIIMIANYFFKFFN